MAGNRVKKLPRVPAIGVHVQLDGHVCPPPGCGFLEAGTSFHLDRSPRSRHSTNNQGGLAVREQQILKAREPAATVHS